MDRKKRGGCDDVDMHARLIMLRTTPPQISAREQVLWRRRGPRQAHQTEHIVRWRRRGVVCISLCGHRNQLKMFMVLSCLNPGAFFWFAL